MATFTKSTPNVATKQPLGALKHVIHKSNKRSSYVLATQQHGAVQQYVNPEQAVAAQQIVIPAPNVTAEQCVYHAIKNAPKQYFVVNRNQVGYLQGYKSNKQKVTRIKCYAVFNSYQAAYDYWYANKMWLYAAIVKGR